MVGAQSLVHGEPPLTGRTEPWMEAALANYALLSGLLRQHGSPINLLDFAPLVRNAGELVAVGAARELPVRVFVARKANKALALVDAARDAGHGVDVASLRELTQCLERGVAPERLIVSAAVKSEALLVTAIRTGVVLSLDNADEMDDVVRLAGELGASAQVALRLACSDPAIAVSRFGLSAAQWRARVAAGLGGVVVTGVHFHLNGYDAGERAVAIGEACALVDALRAMGEPVTFIDMGGGVPMSYLDDEGQWRAFWRALAADEASDAAGGLTWRGDRLGLQDAEADRPSLSTYPFWQREVRGEWLARILDTALEADGTVSEALRTRGLELRCEPGRAVLDGCGMTVAAVAFRKQLRDGQQVVGLHMNRTQLRSTSADVLVDPRWVRSSDTGVLPGMRAFLVGAYCIEDELILRRRMSFPAGVARSDLAAFINTGGYLMHIVESASHQLPLAANLRRAPSGWVRDDIDGVAVS